MVLFKQKFFLLILTISFCYFDNGLGMVKDLMQPIQNSLGYQEKQHAQVTISFTDELMWLHAFDFDYCQGQDNFVTEYVLIKLNQGETEPKLNFSDPKQFNFKYVDPQKRELPQGLYYWRNSLHKENVFQFYGFKTIENGETVNHVVTLNKQDNKFYYKNQPFKPNHNIFHPSITLWGTQQQQQQPSTPPHHQQKRVRQTVQVGDTYESLVDDTNKTFLKKGFVALVLGFPSNQITKQMIESKYFFNSGNDKIQKINSNKKYTFGSQVNEKIKFIKISKKLQPPQIPANLTILDNKTIEELQSDPNSVKDAIFQVASNFHALEGGCNPFAMREDPQNNPLESISKYAEQGEEASISAAPGIIYKAYFDNVVNMLQYFEPESEYPVTINNVKFVIPVSTTGKVNFKAGEKIKGGNKWNMQNNCPIPDLSSLTLDAKTIKKFCNHICIPFLIDVQVTGGKIIEFNKDKQLSKHSIVTDKILISQAFTSALDLNDTRAKDNGYDPQNESIQKLAQLILYAMYEGTIKCAIKYNKKTVYLTLVGAESFKNHASWIQKAIVRQFENIYKYGLQVFLVYPREIDIVQSDASQLIAGLNGEWQLFLSQHVPSKWNKFKNSKIIVKSKEYSLWALLIVAKKTKNLWNGFVNLIYTLRQRQEKPVHE